MSETKIRFTIEPDGRVYQECITTTPIDLIPALEQAFQSSATFKMANVVDFSHIGLPLFGRACLTCSAANTESVWWSIRVRTLNLRTKFSLQDGVLTPVFAGNDASMEMVWLPPDDMRLVLGITMQVNSRGCLLGKHYLVAYDKTGATWRLPLANLYDHLELCHGQDHIYHPTMIAAASEGLKAFVNSVWNADLNGEFQRERAPKLFRWRPINTGFDQIPIEASHWTMLCEKASSDIVTTNMMPI